MTLCFPNAGRSLFRRLATDGFQDGSAIGRRFWFQGLNAGYGLAMPGQDDLLTVLDPPDQFGELALGLADRNIHGALGSQLLGINMDYR